MKLAVVGGGDEGDKYFEDYLSEEMNWMKVCEFTREEQILNSVHCLLCYTYLSTDSYDIK